MEKKEWQQLLKILESTFSDYRQNYDASRNGKNQQIRKDAQRRVDNAIDIAALWIRKYHEAYILLTGNGTDFDRAIFWDEFIKPQWFGKDMPEFLQNLRKQIESM